MITCLISIFFFLYMLKPNFFLTNLFVLERNLIFIVRIFPLVFFLISVVLFNFTNYVDKVFYNLIFSFVFFSLFFCFCRNFSILFIIFLESCVIFILGLIFNFSKDKDKISSAIFIFFLNALGSIPFIFFCFESPYSLYCANYRVNWILRFISIFCFLLILCSKLPVIFFHFWLTKAHVRASGSGSMILASLILKIGSFGLLKFCNFFFRHNYSILKNFILEFSLLGRLFLVVTINRFFDLKYVVACSSIFHISLIFPFILNFSYIGVVSSIMIMVGHGIVSCFIFFLVTLFYEKSVRRSFDLNKSLESSRKFLSLYFFIFFLINLGFPPFIRFIREFLFLCALTNFGVISILFFCLIFILAGKVFMTIIIISLFGKKNLNFYGSRDSRISVFSLLYFVYFSLVPLIYFYSDSLKKNIVLWWQRFLE